MSIPELQLAAPLTKPSSSVVYALSMALVLMRQVERALLVSGIRDDLDGRRVRRLCCLTGFRSKLNQIHVLRLLCTQLLDTSLRIKTCVKVST